MVRGLVVALADSGQLVAGEPPEQVACEVECCRDVPPLLALVHEPLLEVVGEGEVAAVVLAERGGADDGGQVADLPSPGVAGVELVGDVAVVVAGAARADPGSRDSDGSTSIGRKMPARSRSRDSTICPSVM